MLNALYVLEIITFLFWYFCYVKKGRQESYVDKKAMANF